MLKREPVDDADRFALAQPAMPAVSQPPRDCARRLARLREDIPAGGWDHRYRVPEPGAEYRLAAGRLARVDPRIRDAYDKVAAKYAERFAGELAYKPLDRALLGAFSEQVGRLGMIADIGCGPGHVTAYLAGLGVTVRGIDPSPAMIGLARRRYPGLDFAVGELPGLRLPAGGLAGAVIFYSIIHLTAQQRAAAFAELAQALCPGGMLLIAFHLGDDEKIHVDTWLGEDVWLDGYRLSVQTVTGEVETAGVSVCAVLQREGYPEVESSGTRRGYLLARKATAR